MKIGALAGMIILISVGAAAKPRSRETSDRRAEADAFYQAGTDYYAHGGFPQALSAFQEALRRDPDDRAARLAIDRVRQEIAMTASATPPRPSASRSIPQTEDEDPLLSSLVRFFAVETIGDERDQEGAIEARQGRIAQLLIERKVSRSLRRTFSKDAELHALSRRLS
jgi:tetratricopeptide (TPR) repeat protein